MSDRKVSMNDFINLFDTFTLFIEKIEHLLDAEFDDEDMKYCVILDVINTAQRNKDDISEKINSEIEDGTGKTETRLNKIHEIIKKLTDANSKLHMIIGGLTAREENPESVVNAVSDWRGLIQKSEEIGKIINGAVKELMYV